MKSANRWTQMRLVSAAGAICFVVAQSASAQITTQQSTTAHPATVETKVERGEVVYVQGNDLMVKMEDGTIRHLSNVPESARVTVDGKELGIHDLKTGMKLERTITTSTIPKTVTTVQSVNGTVWHVTPPTSVILKLEDGTNQKFNIPKGQKFDVDGQMVDAFSLKKGMKITATKVIEAPEIEVQEQKTLSGSMPPPPPPPADKPILLAVATSPAAPVASAEPAAASSELPRTASPLPLLGLLAILCIGTSLGVKTIRREY
jgi:hypothetical protein